MPPRYLADALVPLYIAPKPLVCNDQFNHIARWVTSPRIRICVQILHYQDDVMSLCLNVIWQIERVVAELQHCSFWNWDAILDFTARTSPAHLDCICNRAVWVSETLSFLLVFCE